MIGKNNLKKQYERQAEKVETYSIKKFKAGAASVLIGVGLFFGAGAAEASDSAAQINGNNKVDNSKELNASTETSVEVKPVEKKIENTREKVAEAVAEKLNPQTSEKAQAAKKTQQEADKTLLLQKIEELKVQLERIKNNSKQPSIIDEATKKLESVEVLIENNPTQVEVDKKVREISSYVAILKSIKAEVETEVKDDNKIEISKKEVDNSKEKSVEKSTNSEELKKVTEELSKAVFNARDLTSADDKKVVEEAKTVIKDANASLDNSSLTKAELDDLFKRATKSRNSVMNVITRFMSGKRDFRNGKEIPKEDLRADASVSNEALYGHLTFLDSNGVSKNISEDTIPVVSNGDGKRVLKLQLGFSSSSATPIKNGKIRYIIPKNHLNTDVKPSLSNSALASGSPKDLSDENNYIYEIPLNTITGGAVGQLNIEHQISSSIDKSPSAGDTTIARAEFYNGDELISTTTATARYEYLSQILYKESDKKENKNLFDYVPGYYDRDLIVGSKNSDGTFSPIKGNTFTLPFITYDRGKEFLQGTDVGDKNGNGRLTDVDYTITGIPEFLELVPTVATNRYWTLEGNVAKLNYDKTSVDAYKRPTRVGQKLIIMVQSSV